MSIREDLAEFFGDSSGRRAAVVGVGSLIRGDDAAGMLVVDRLRARGMEGALLVSAETVPESYTGEIEAFGATHVLLVDAADFGGEPGEARIIPKERVGGFSVSTHSLPLTVFINVIEKTVGAKVALLGIQVEDISFGVEASEAVKRASALVADAVYRIFV